MTTCKLQPRQEGVKRLHPVIENWHWDDDNIEHLARHSLTPEIVIEVAGDLPLFRENLRGRAASHQMIGPDRMGETWVISIRGLSWRRGFGEP